VGPALTGLRLAVALAPLPAWRPLLVKGGGLPAGLVLAVGRSPSSLS